CALPISKGSLRRAFFRAPSAGADASTSGGVRGFARPRSNGYHARMPAPQDPRPLIDQLTEDLVVSYHAEDRLQHLGATFLPKRDKVIARVEMLRRLVFPGFFDEVRLTAENVHDHTRQLLAKLYHELYEQIHQTLRYELNITEGDGAGDDCETCE